MIELIIDKIILMHYTLFITIFIFYNNINTIIITSSKQILATCHYHNKIQIIP